MTKKIQPYLFALKEGKKIQKDLLDYSLLMIHVQNHEIMKSPLHYDPLIPIQNYQTELRPSS